MGDLVWVRIFPPKSLELEIFSLKYNSVRFFFSIVYVMSDIFFSAGHYFSSYILASFSLSKSVCRIFFLKSPITPSKVIRSVPKIHQTFVQLADSELTIISKAV